MKKYSLVPLVLVILLGFIGCNPRDEVDPPEACFEIYPDDVVYLGEEVSFVNCSDNEDSYEWDFGDNETAKSESPDHTYDEEGEYDVTLVVENSGGTDQITQVVTVLGLSGTWDKSFDIDGTLYEGTLTLEQDGNDLSGSFVFSDGSGYTQILSGSNVNENDVLIKWMLESYECSFLGDINNDYDYMEGDEWTVSGIVMGSWEAEKNSKKSSELSKEKDGLTDLERFVEQMKNK